MRKTAYKKYCPKCERPQYYSSQNSLDLSLKNNTRCKSCAFRGRVFSDEHKHKIAQSHTKHGTSMFSHLYSNYKNTSVNRRGLTFELDKETFRKITSSICHYCGAAPAQFYRLKRRSETYFYNGIDRVDNSRGYVVDNVVPCCVKCNKMKANMKVTDFLRHINGIYQYMSGCPHASTSA